MSGDALAAAAQISAANRRAAQVRAEAALLVEAVEDRAASVRGPRPRQNPIGLLALRASAIPCAKPCRVTLSMCHSAEQSA